MNENTEKDTMNLDTKNEKKPDETGGFYFSSSIKIFNPNTKEILVQKRGDN